MKKIESGRSMVEMLGVLAIIGVLSIGGIAGYTMAMNRHKANRILDMASKLSVVAQTNYAADPNGNWNTDAYKELELDDSLSKYETTFWVEPNGDVYVAPVPEGVSKALKSIVGDDYWIIEGGHSN